jgi:predicted DNA repair protein MutK
MAGGLAALLDDVAVLARMAAASADDVAAAAGKASVKAAGVVVDDTAVTPQYVRDVEPSRELPIIRKIATGSLGNKAIIIVLALLLSQFIPWLLTPILMCGGVYLAFEGAEKVWERVSGHHHEEDEPVLEQGEDAERKLVRGAITTDFILSAEIMVISLNEVASESFWSRAAILVVVGIGITILVYGVVAIIVKMDDVGMHLAQKDSPGMQRFGNGLVKAMPTVLDVISFVGMLAMLWVGGHILLVGLDELGVTGPYHLVHLLEEPASHVAGIGAVLGWLVNTVCSGLFGLLVGAVVVAIMHVIPGRKKDGHGEADAGSGHAGHGAAGTRDHGPVATADGTTPTGDAPER